MQNSSNSNASVVELLQTCAKQSKYLVKWNQKLYHMNQLVVNGNKEFQNNISTESRTT